jgi:hypothetical protein
MFKWIFRIIIGLILFVLLALFALKIYLENYFDKNIIVREVEANTNARFELEDISIGLFSFTPSLELDKVKIGKRDQYADDKVHIDERPKMENEIVSIENIELKANLFPLLHKKFELNKFIISEPKMKLTIGKKGDNNLSQLMKKTDSADDASYEEQEDQASEEAAEETSNSETSSEKPAKEFNAKDVPIAAELNQIGIEKGEIDILFKATDQRFLISDLYIVISQIDFDPKNLEQHNKAHITIDTDLLISNKDNKEQAKLILRSHADIRPMDPKTGKIEPEALYDLTIKEGSFIVALVAMEKVKSSLSTLEQMGLDLSLLSKKAVVKEDANTKIRYKEGKISFEEELKVETGDYDITIQKDGWFNVLNNQHSFKGNLLLSKSESDKLLKNVDSYIDEQISKAKGVKIDKAQVKKDLLSGIVKDGRVSIDFSSKGDISDPDVKVTVLPPSLTKIIQKQAGSIIEDKAKEEGEKQGKKLLKNLF